MQVVFNPQNQNIFQVAEHLRSEDVVKITGTVTKRPTGTENPKVATGTIDIVASGLEVLNKSEVPPFPLDYEPTNEDLKLTYRYLDLRRRPMLENLKTRHKTVHTVRNFFNEQDFLEIETPILFKSTPEGAREYLVPSRANPGKFFALPQSPQQFKQLLMVSGIEKYFQFARCMRDEDTRGDRQPEFTQLDMEMSFITEEDIIQLNEKLLISIVEKFYPEKKIQQVPFPRISYKDSMEKYGNDRPDIRKDKEDKNLLAFCWVIDFPAFEKTSEDNVDGTGEWTFTHNPFTRVRDEYMNDYMEGKNIGELISTQYDITLNGFEIGGGGLRSYKPEMLKKTFQIMGYTDKKIEMMFGHMIAAMKFGAPPHGGIAWGFDRFMMLVENEPNIREVIPFAKTGEGKDLMMNAPAGISDKQKSELGINISKTNL